MADSGLFLMQRYVGSEGEDSDEANATEPSRDSVLKDKLANLAYKNKQDKPKKVPAKKKASLHPEKNVLNNKEKRKSKITEKCKEGKPSDETFRVLGQAKTSTQTKIKPVLPKWLSNPTFIEISLGKKYPISELSYLDKDSKKHLEEAGINYLFPVQSCVIPWLLQNSSQKFTLLRPSDVCVSAPTGSGKTLAFVLPIVQSLKTRVKIAIRALVVLPVAELAVQVYNVFCDFVKGTGLRVILLSGQKSFHAEQNALVEQGMNKPHSCVDIVVTTPGRVLDHIHKTNGFCLRQLRYLVIDEADRMMEEIQQGWLKQVESAAYQDSHSACCACFDIGGRRASSLPSTACLSGYVDTPLQKLLYSATLSQDPESLHALSLYRPKLFTAPSAAPGDSWIGKCAVPEGLEQLYLVCRDETRALCLYHFVRQRRFGRVLCFVDSVERARRLRLILEGMGDLRVGEVSSGSSAAARRAALKRFDSGELGLLVCSDLVGRGVDFRDIDCVVSYDVPYYVKKHVHRIGRTARAGKGGTALTLVAREEVNPFRKMLLEAGMPMPSLVEIREGDLERYVPAFRKALAAADVKFKQLNSGPVQQRTGVKRKQKRNEDTATPPQNTKKQ